MKTRVNYVSLIRGKRQIAAVISHTHWDRAWYQPFEQFRMSLCRVVKRLLDILETDPRFTSFTFDGQSVVLEDYLEIHPEDRSRLEQLIRTRRLVVGPSYVLPDFFLITGESLIRNGIIGQDVANGFGRCSRQGYVADPFGLVSQVPQIWAGLGLESIFFSRGLSRKQRDEAGSVFWWQAPDGKSRILAVLQVEGYSNMLNWGVPCGAYPRQDPDTQHVDFAYSETQVRKLLDAYARLKGDRSRILFFGNGNDHHAAQHRLPDLIAHNRAAFPDTAFVQVDTDGFVRLLRQERAKFRTIRGELHQPGAWDTLNGTLDSRPYLKQQYDAAASRIERYAEPLSTLVDLLQLPGRFVREQHHVGFAFNVGNNATHDPAYPAAHLRYAWKMLLRNAPHDDVCGCSVDATHDDAENRAKRVQETASLLAENAALRLADSVRTPAFASCARLFVFNPLAFARRAVIEKTLSMAAGSTKLEVVDHAGRVVPAAIEARVTAPHYRRWHSDGFEDLPGQAVEAKVSLPVDLPALGYCTLYVREAPRTRTVRREVKRLPTGMENACVRVKLNRDGTFDVRDKRTGAVYSGLNRLRDQGDGGDLYISTLLADGMVTAQGACARIRCVAELPHRVAYEVKVRLPGVPIGLDPERQRRAGRRMPIDVVFTYTLLGHSPAVQIRAEWMNRHTEHRLCADFPTGIRTRKLEAQSVFDVVEHTAPFVQEACRDFVTVTAMQRRATILSRGMHSYDARLEKGRVTIGKCLLKASGWIIGKQRPYMQASGGNCLRRIVQEYAFLPGAATDSWHSLWQEADAFCHGVYCEYHLAKPAGSLPPAESFLDVEGPFVVTAFKRCEERRSLLVRVVNMGDGAAGGRLKLSPLLACHAAWRTNLAERRIRRQPVKNNTIALQARSREIVSFELIVSRV